jgi:MFS family permease
MQLYREKNVYSQAIWTFYTYVTSVFLASFGRGAFYLGSSWLLVEEGYGAIAVAHFFGIVSAAELISSPIAGWITDRWDRRWLSVCADGLRSAVALGMACVVVPDIRQVIFVSAFALVFAERLAMTASQTLLPGMCQKMVLPRANSVVFLSMQCGNFLAAVLGGYLLAAYGFRPFCMAIMVAFALSAAAMLLVRPGRIGISKTANEKRSANARGVRLVDVVALYSLLYGCATLISVLGASLVFDEMRGNAVIFGLIEGAWAIGSIIGAVLLMPISRHMEVSHLGLPILALTATALIGTPLMSFPLQFALFGILGLLYNLGRVNVEVLLQSIVTNGELGRVKGWTHSLGVLIGAVVLVTVSIVGDTVLPSALFSIFGLLIAFATGIMFVTARRRG